MIIWENTKFNPVAHLGSMSQVNIVFAVENHPTGIRSRKSASPVILTNHGTQTLTCVNAVHLQDLSKEANACVQHRRLNGTPTPKHATAQQTHSVIFANLAQHQDSGTLTRKNACVRLQKPNGIPLINNANARQEDMEIIVLNAPLLDTGIWNKTIVSALPQEQFGILLLLHVNVHLDFMDLTVKLAPLQGSGTLNKTLAFAPLPEQFGTQPKKLATVHQDSTAHNV